MELTSRATLSSPKVTTGVAGTGRTTAPRAPEASPPDTAHHHVAAVQDWGGSQEHWHGWSDQEWTRDRAEQHVRDMVRADSLWWDQQGNQPDATEVLTREFGDSWTDLISANVAPGYNAIWIIECAEPCTWSLSDDVPGKPWWSR